MDDSHNRIKINPISVPEARRRLKIIKPKLIELQKLVKKFEVKSLKLAKHSQTEKDLQKLSKERYETDQIEESISIFEEEIMRLDCIIKDLNNGLIDFICLKDGRPVWLCYQINEPDLIYYHEWNAGFAGRKFIDFE